MAEPIASSPSGRCHDQPPPRQVVGAWLVAVIGVMGPCVVLVFVLSEIGIGEELFQFVAHQSLVGDFIVFCGFLISGFYYVVCYTPDRKWSVPLTMALAYIVFFVAALFKGRKYPWASMLMVLVAQLIFMIPVANLAALSRQKVAQLFSFLLFISFVLLMVCWLAYHHLHDNNIQWSRIVESDLAERFSNTYEEFQVNISNCTSGPTCEAECFDMYTARCAKATTVVFLAWASPVAMAFINLGASGVLLAAGKFLGRGADMTTFSGFFVFGVTLVLGGLYLSVHLAEVSANFSLALEAMLFLALVILLGVYLCEQKIERENESYMYRQLMIAKESHWVRAVAIGSMVVPTFYCLETMRQKRHPVKTTDEGECGRSAADAAEAPVVRLHKELQNWWKKLPNTFLKICILGELFFTLQVGGAKFTYVFLSWMNEYLSQVSFGSSVAIVFLIGYVMFLLPPVPGVPIYVFCGIVLVKHGKPMMGFFVACLFATAVAFCLKLAACTAQYGIGVWMGQKVRVLQFIGVDTAATRALEKILKQPGMHCGKVSVLVGGPDWPTSVLSGILRVNLVQMLLGTLPTFFTAMPCVLAGAFMSDAKPGENSNRTVLASLFTMLAAAVQMSVMFSATYQIHLVIDKEGEALVNEDRTDRPEYAAVKAQDEKDQKYNEEYEKLTEWSRLMVWEKIAIIAAVVLMLGFGYVVQFLGNSVCFENFEVNGRISDPLNKYGLNGNPLNIVKWPGGWAAIFGFILAVLLHIAFMHLTRGRVTGKNSSETENSSETGLLLGETQLQCCPR